MSKQDKSQDAEHGALGDAYDKVSDRVVTAYTQVRDVASNAAHSTATGVDANPLVALLGGLALGALAGAVLPRAAREKELLEPLGAKLGDAVRAAFEAGRTAGVDAFADAGFGTENLRSQASKLVEQALNAAGVAGTAALGAARDAATHSS